MHQYQQLIRRILDEGVDVPDRTGVGTRSVFGHQMRFRLSEGFPLVTVKRTFWKGAFTEMLWMLRGDTNIDWLHQHGVHIWREWADENGNLGPIYGEQLRRWEGIHGVDQIAMLIEGLRDDPHSRRHVVSAWSPIDLPDPRESPQQNVQDGQMALAPCHCLIEMRDKPRTFSARKDSANRASGSCLTY